MSDLCTVDELMRPLMGKPSIIREQCAVCGCHRPLNQHHIVRRGAGKLIHRGHEMGKPTVTLCGSGNTSGCHGLAHAQRLHFRWVDTVHGEFGRTKIPYGTTGGHWECLITDEPTKYQDALTMDGWRAL